MSRWILLIEDSADDVELTRAALEENQIRNRLVVARDGAQAIEILSSHRLADLPDLPAVILLDLNLPKVNGIEVLRYIRGQERTRLVPVVVLTSSDEQRDLTESYQLGANSYIRKPVDFAEFVTAMDHLGCYWLLLNHTAADPA